MGKIKLTPEGIALIREHLREEILKSPETAQEILDAAKALNMPVRNLLIFIAGGDIGSDIAAPE